MKRPIRSVTAQAAPANPASFGLGDAAKLLNPIKGVGGAADLMNTVTQSSGKLLDTVTQFADEKGNPKTEANIPQMTDLDIAERDMRTKLIGLGVPAAQIDEFVTSMMSQGAGAGIGRAQTYEALGEIAVFAESSGVGFAEMFPVIKATAKSRHYNLKDVMAVLSGINRYASKYPGMNIWNMAIAAAQGKNISEALFFVRTVIRARSKGEDSYQETMKLYQAIMAITTPGTPITNLVSDFADAKQRNLQKREEMQLKFTAINAQWATQTEIELYKLYSSIAKALPALTKNPWFIAYMHSAATVAAASALVKDVSNRALFKPGLTPQTIGDSKGVTGMGSTMFSQPQSPQSVPTVEKAAISAAARTVLAESADAVAQPPQPQPPQPQATGAPLGNAVNQANQVAQDSMQGKASGAYMGAQKFQPEIAAKIRQSLQFEDKLLALKAAYDSAMSTLNNLTTIGVKGASTDDEEIMTPYLDPETIAEMSVQAVGYAVEGRDTQQRLYNLYLQQPEKLKELIKVNSENKHEDSVEASYQALVQYEANRVSEWIPRILLAKRAQVACPKLQNIKVAMPYYEYYDMMLKNTQSVSNGFYGYEFAEPLQKICVYMANQYFQIAQDLKQLVSQDMEVEGALKGGPKMVQAFQYWINKYTLAAQTKQAEAVKVGNLMNTALYGNNFNDPGLSALHRSSSTKFERIATDIKDEEKVATTTEEEWSLIYDGTDAAGYGKILESPHKYIDIPTTDVEPSGERKKKVIPKIKLDQ